MCIMWQSISSQSRRRGCRWEYLQTDVWSRVSLFTLYRPGQPNWEHTMWKFQYFSAIQILCEITFWSFWSPKNCHFDYFSSYEFWIYGNFWHFQVWILPKIKSQSLPNYQNTSFWPSKISQNWFHVKSKWQKKGQISTLWHIHTLRNPN